MLLAMDEAMNPMTTPERRAEVVCSVHAVKLMPYLARFRRPRDPLTPVLFRDLSDSEILELVSGARKSIENSAKGKNSPLQIDQDRLEWFGRWRRDVIEHEYTSESRLLCLLRAAASFKRQGDENTVYNLMMFAGTEYGFHMTDPPMEPLEQLDVARRHSRRIDIMSDKLMEEGYRTWFRKNKEDEPVQVGMDMEGVF